jgi:hypothetical protein
MLSARLLGCSCLAVVIFCFSERSTFAEIPHQKIQIEIEGGPAFQTRNDVQIPTDTGSRFSLVNFSSGPFASARGTLLVSPWPRHYFRLLIAPFTAVVHGVPSSAISFFGSNFAADTSTEGVYRFNSYRLTYAFRAIWTEKWELAVGFTGKIRDAEISLRQGNLRASRYDVGFVPLLHLFARFQPNEDWAIVFDGDGLAAPQGRAFDLALKGYYTLAPQWKLFFGYRMVEGGTEGGGTVYNVAWIHSALVGLRWGLE